MSSFDPPLFAARMLCSTTANRAAGHYPVATSTTNELFGNSLSHAGHCMAERKAEKKVSNCPKLQK